MKSRIKILKTTSLFLAATACQLYGDNYIFSITGNVDFVSIFNVSDFPSDVVANESFQMQFDYDLDFWKWEDAGQLSQLMPEETNQTGEGMTFTLTIGGTTWSLNSSELFDTSNDFLKVEDDKNFFGNTQDLLEIDLATNSVTSSGFPSSLGNVRIELLMTDQDGADFITIRPPLDSSHVNVGNVETQTFYISDRTDTNDKEWTLGMTVEDISITVVPEFSQYALFLGIGSLALLTKRRSNKSE